jgi:hypothetical protein
MGKRFSMTPSAGTLTTPSKGEVSDQSLAIALMVMILVAAFTGS